MERDPTPSKQVEVEGFMFREYFIGRFSIGGDGPSAGGLNPLPRARMTLGERSLEVEILMSTVKHALTRWVTGGSWSYHEFERAQVFESPHWARWRGLSTDEYPVGVRLHLGESRAAMLFFSTRVEALLEALERHSVSVGRTPIKLSPWLVGRK